MMDPTAVVLALFLDWLAKGFLILGLAFLLDRLLQRRNASLHLLIWLVGLATVTLIPTFSLLVPSVKVPLIRLTYLSAAAATGTQATAAGFGAGIGMSAAQILLSFYALGALTVLVWQLIGRGYTYRLRRKAVKITEPRVVAELRRLRAVLGIRMRVDLLSSDLTSMPFCVGFLHPVIVLPRATSSWPAPILESVLVHELAHIRRKDVLTRVAAQVCCCIHWINPLAWYGFRQIVLEQEIACDSLVLATGTKPSAYARNLLALADIQRGKLDLALTAMGRRTELKGRLLEILKPTRSRTPLRIGGSLVFLILALGLILPVSALNIWDAAETGKQHGPDNGLRAEGPAQPPGPATALPDIELVKKKISQKYQDMKTAGLPKEQLEKFMADSKAKLAKLQAEKKKEEELRKPRPAK